MVANRRMCYACGDKLVNYAVVEVMRREAADLTIARAHLSLWVEKGLSDVSCALHSTGMSYWNVLLSFAQVIERGNVRYLACNQASRGLTFDLLCKTQ